MIWLNTLKERLYFPIKNGVAVTPLEKITARLLEESIY